MEMYYQIMASLGVGTLCVMFFLFLRERRKATHAISNVKQTEVNLRRELHDTSEQLGTQKDITKFFKQLLNYQSDAAVVFRLTQQGEVSPCGYANEAALDLLEVTEEELPELECFTIEEMPEDEIGSGPMDINQAKIGSSSEEGAMATASNRRIRNQVKGILQGKTFERNTRFITKEKHIIPVALRIFCCQRGNTNFMVYVIRDLREQRKLEKSLYLAEKQYNELFQSSQIGVALYDIKHNLLRVNQAWLRIFGCPSIDEMRLLDIFAPPVISEEKCNQLNRGESLDTEVILDFDSLIKEHSFVTNRRRKSCLNIFFINLGRDQYQQQHGFLVQITDKTDLRENESALAMREAQLLQAQKMASIGMMTGGIAHDFNNILTPILGYSEIGVDLCEDNEILHEYIHEIHTASLRAKELVSQILVYSRQSDEDLSPIHLIPIVKEVIKQQTSVLAPDIKVVSRIRTKDDFILANPTQMHQVMTNLATNAAYAMRKHGGDKLDVQVTTFNMGWRHRHEFPQLRKGSYLRLTIKDNGPGIPEEIREKIFNPFFSTKPHGEGTGMGLAVVKGIIDGAGGAIALESTEEEGSTFHIALPLLEEQPEPDRQEWNAPMAGGKSVLFIDDEPAIVKMAGHVLKSIGFQPLLCNTPQEAIDILEQENNTIDIMLTDYAMPEFSGTEMATAARQIRPNLPVIILTGHPAEVDQEESHDAGVRAILCKPTSKKELERVISLVLQGRDLLKEAMDEKPIPKALEIEEETHENA